MIPIGTDIQVLPQNNFGGDDKIIGDIHGNRDCLEAVLQSLKPGDRLFIVGDLTDRGEDSPGVVALILEFQAAHPDQLYVTRGNHESMCLSAITCLEKMVEALVDEMYIDHPTAANALLVDAWQARFMHAYKTKNLFGQYDNANVSDLNHHLRNGGAWLLRLFREELDVGLIDKKGDEIIYDEKSQVGKIKAFIEQLPYIIRVQGQRPFNVVHADLPFSEHTLLNKIASNELALEHMQKKHAQWAREDSMSLPTRSDASKKNYAPTYVGHSIIAEGDAKVIRKETNTINLDVAAYATGASLIANHTQGTCEFIGTPVNNAHLIAAQAKLSEYMRSQHSLSHEARQPPRSFFKKSPTLDKALPSALLQLAPFSPTRRRNKE